MAGAMASLGFDGFLNGIATVIAEHVGVADAAIASPPPIGPADPLVLDHEKIVWHYPDATDRIVEDVP